MLRIKNVSKPFLAGMAVGFFGISGIIGSSAHAQNYHQNFAPNTAQQTLPVKQVPLIWAGLDNEQRKMVDMIASDFFDTSLNPGQKITMVYRTPQQNITIPTYFDLQEYQKAPFRRYAMDQLQLHTTHDSQSAPAHYRGRKGSV